MPTNRNCSVSSCLKIIGKNWVRHTFLQVTSITPTIAITKRRAARIFRKSLQLTITIQGTKSSSTPTIFTPDHTQVAHGIQTSRASVLDRKGSKGEGTRTDAIAERRAKRLPAGHVNTQTIHNPGVNCECTNPGVSWAVRWSVDATESANYMKCMELVECVFTRRARYSASCVPPTGMSQNPYVRPFPTIILSNIRFWRSYSRIRCGPPSR